MVKARLQPRDKQSRPSGRKWALLQETLRRTTAARLQRVPRQLSISIPPTFASARPRRVVETERRPYDRAWPKTDGPDERWRRQFRVTEPTIDETWSNDAWVKFRRVHKCIRPIGGIGAGSEGLKICAIAMTLVSNGEVVCLPIHMSIH